MHRIAIGFVIALAACAPAPDIGGPELGALTAADYPTLQPLETALADPNGVPPQLDETSGPVLLSRAERLRLRAAKLREMEEAQ